MISSKMLHQSLWFYIFGQEFGMIFIRRFGRELKKPMKSKLEEEAKAGTHKKFLKKRQRQKQWHITSEKKQDKKER